MIKILNTFAGSNSKNKIAIVKNNILYYGSDSNIIKIDNKKITDVIFLNGVINCLRYKDNIIIAGDTQGMGYIIENDRIIKNIDTNENIVDCIMVNMQYFIFCNLSKILIIDLIDNKRIVIDTNYLITCIDRFDHDKFIIGDTVGNIHIYIFANGTFEYKENIQAHKDGIKDIANRGNVIATCSQDYNIKIWSVTEKLRHLQTLNGHSDWVNSIFFIGDKLVSGSSDKTIRIWEKEGSECNTGYITGEIIGGSSPFLFVSMLNSKIVGQYKSGGFDIFDLNAENDDEYLISGHQAEINDLDWKDGLILSASSDNTTRLFYDGKEIGRAQIHGWGIRSAKFIPHDKMRFISGGDETILRVFECTKNFIMNYLDCISSNADQSEVRVSSNADQSEVRISSNADQSEGSKRVSSNTDQSEGSKRVSAISSEHIKREFNWLNQNYIDDCILSELNLTPRVIKEFRHLPLSENSLYISVFNEIKKIYGHFFDVTNVNLNSKFIFSANKSSSRQFSGLFVWNHDFKKIHYLCHHELGITKIKANEKNIITVSRDKSMCLYAVENNEIQLIKHYHDHSRLIWDAAISEKFFATSSRDKKIILYSFNNFKIYKTKMFESEVTAIEFFEDFVIAGFDNGIIRFLDFQLQIISEKKICNKKINVIKSCGNGVIAVGGADGLLRTIIFNN